MAINYIYGVKSVKYGTPTGTATMPASGSMTPLPDRVKGSIAISEADGTSAKFYVEQKPHPIKVIKTEEGEFSASMEFYDLDYTTVAALKGGVGNASGWTPSNTFVNIELALSIEMDSGQVIDFYNASCDTTLNFAGGRDTMGSMKMVAMPQLTADGTGTYHVG